MFDLEQFTADCRAALAADKSHKHVHDASREQSAIRLPC
jgi:hypothetical protein